MPVLDLVMLTTRYRSVYHGFTSWADLTAQMLTDPYDADTLGLLVAELREHGAFRQPVTLGVYEQWDIEPGRPDEDDVLVASFDAVLDGTHRVCAHLLAGVNDVLVRYDGEDERYVGGFAMDENDPTYNLIMSSKIEVPLPLAAVAPARVVAKEDFDEREADLDLWETLMSLRINAGVWITSPTSGSSRENGVLRYAVTWDAEAFRVLPDAITACVREKLHRFGYNADAFVITTVLEDMAEDEPVPVDAVTALAGLLY